MTQCLHIHPVIINALLQVDLTISWYSCLLEAFMSLPSIFTIKHYLYNNLPWELERQSWTASPKTSCAKVSRSWMFFLYCMPCSLTYSLYTTLHNPGLQSTMGSLWDQSWSVYPSPSSEQVWRMRWPISRSYAGRPVYVPFCSSSLSHLDNSHFKFS